MTEIGFIGVAKLDGGYTKKKYFYVKSEHEKNGPKGGHNYYRVLPPVHSGASTGKWSHYQATHEVVNTQGQRRTFKCIREMDWKTKTTTVHCPFCDIATANANKAKAYEQQGVGKDELKAFNDNYVNPYRSQSFYYVNVTDMNNEIGVLQLKTALHTDLKAKALEYQSKGVDLFGMRGFYLDFQKISQYKGDNKPVYKVEIMRDEKMDANGNFTGTPKIHEITPEFATRMKTECFDLANMYKELTPEQIQALASNEGPIRAQLVDKLWATPERDQAPENNPAQVRIGSSDMYAVGRVEADTTGINMVMPNMSATPHIPELAKTVVPTPHIPELQAVAQAQTLVAPAQPTVVASTPTIPAGNPAQMTDDEFKKAFGGIM